MTERYRYKVGRPPREDGPTKTLTFRLSLEELEALEANAEKREKTRSEAIRDSLEQCGYLTPPKKRA